MFIVNAEVCNRNYRYFENVVARTHLYTRDYIQKNKELRGLHYVVRKTLMAGFRQELKKFLKQIVTAINSFRLNNIKSRAL